MYSFLVLGLIPGTNISISFQAWLVLGGLLLAARPAYKLYLRCQALMTESMVRQPLPASQLHQRLHLMAR